VWRVERSPYIIYVSAKANRFAYVNNFMLSLKVDQANKYVSVILIRTIAEEMSMCELWHFLSQYSNNSYLKMNLYYND
jgi:hypothetical protein